MDCLNISAGPRRGQDSAMPGDYPAPTWGRHPALTNISRALVMLSRENVLASLRYGQQQLGRLGVATYLTRLLRFQTALRGCGARPLAMLQTLP
jgi:hypothetical protein